MATRWLIILSVLFSALLLGFTGWHAWEWHRAGDEMLSRRLQSINRVFTPSLAEAAHNEDMSRVHQLLTRLTSDPAILNATLRDESGSVRDFTGSIPPPADLGTLPTTLSRWNQNGTQRWIQPLEAFLGPESPHRYWLDLSLDPLSGTVTMTRFFNGWTPLLSLLLLIPAALAWRHSRQVDSVARRQDKAVVQARDQPPRSTVLEATPSLSGNLSYVSHELRAPLSGVLGFCRLLENSPLDAQQREWLRHIHLASNGLLDTVDLVLGDTRRCRPDNVFDIGEVLWEVLCLQTPLAQSRRMTLLAIVYDDVPPRLMGSDVGIRQLLTNLINNAIKYGGEGDVVTRIVLESRQGSAVRLRLSVSDDGHADACHRERLQQALARGYDGPMEAEAGVGVAICHRLVAEMDGSLALATRSGKANTVVANIGLEACEPYVRPAEFDLEGAEIALWQPHTRLAHLLDYALKRWNAHPGWVTDPDLWVASGDSSQLSIIGIDEDALDPEAHRIWQRRFNAMGRPCLLVANLSPTQSLTWRLPRGSVVLRLPISRYILGRTLAKILAETRQRDLPARPRILVVDDDEVSQHYLDAVLPIIGVDVVVAGNAEDAIAAASKQTIDLVLMDLHLPDANGFETTHRLRRLNDDWQHTPVIAMTAEPDSHHRHRLADDDINEMLTKPLDEHLLRGVLARYLPGMTLATAAPEAESSLDGARPGPEPSDADSFEPASLATGPSDIVAFETEPFDAATSMPVDPETPRPRDTIVEDRNPQQQRSAPEVDSSRETPSLHAGDLPVVDKAQARQISGGREALAEEMMKLLIGELPRYRQELDDAWQRQDAEQLVEVAHQLGGGCRYCGTPQLAEACDRLESRCRHHSLEECAEALRDLMAACDRLTIWADDQTLTDTR